MPATSAVVLVIDRDRVLPDGTLTLAVGEPGAYVVEIENEGIPGEDDFTIRADTRLERGVTEIALLFPCGRVEGRCHSVAVSRKPSSV